MVYPGDSDNDDDISIVIVTEKGADGKFEDDQKTKMMLTVV